MRALIYLPFGLSFAFLGLSRLVCRRVSPRPAAWSITVAMVLLAGSSVGALGLLAWPLAARIPAIASAGRWRPDAVNHRVPVPISVSMGATLALVAVGGLVLNRLRGLWRQFAETSRLHAALVSTGGEGLAVLDDPVPAAHALPPTLAHCGRILVSTGLIEALDNEERAAALAHERAHLSHRHYLFVLVGALASAMNPLLGFARGDVSFALERWADEDAASRTSRTVTARALAKAAVARLSRLHAGVVPGVAMQLAQLGVVQRVAALLEPQERPARRGLAWVITGLALVGTAAVAWSVHDTERIFEVLQAR